MDDKIEVAEAEFVYDENDKVLYSSQKLTLDDLTGMWRDFDDRSCAMDNPASDVQNDDQDVKSPGPTPTASPTAGSNPQSIGQGMPTGNISISPAGSIQVSTTGYITTTTAVGAQAGTTGYRWVLPLGAAVRDDTPKHIPMLQELAQLVRVLPNSGDVDFYDFIGDDLKRYNVLEVVEAALNDLTFFHGKAKNFPHKP